jgi:hypothetical protein
MKPRRLTLSLLAKSVIALQERVETLEAQLQGPTTVLSPAIGFEVSPSAELASYDPLLP